MIFYRDPATVPTLSQAVDAEEKHSNRSVAMDFLMVMVAVVMMCSAYFIITINRSHDARLAKTVYTVAEGDTLGKLAKRFYGSHTEWQRIYNANKRTVKNPDRLEVGTRLTIPPAESADAGSANLRR